MRTSFTGQPLAAVSDYEWLIHYDTCIIWLALASSAALVLVKWTAHSGLVHFSNSSLDIVSLTT